ncbi:MAG: hypothetical protein ABSB36_09900 [Candidatus Dormibacteria bacterium]
MVRWVMLDSDFGPEVYRKGFTFGEFALFAGVSDATVSRAANRGRIRLNTARCLVEALMECPPNGPLDRWVVVEKP